MSDPNDYPMFDYEFEITSEIVLGITDLEFCDGEVAAYQTWLAYRTSDAPGARWAAVEASDLTLGDARRLELETWHREETLAENRH